MGFDLVYYTVTEQVDPSWLPAFAFPNKTTKEVNFIGYYFWNQLYGYFQ